MFLTSSNVTPHLRNSDRSRPRTLIPLGSHNLVIMAPQPQPLIRPRLEVVTNIDTPTNPLRSPHAPKLIKRLGPLNAGLVVPRALGNGVGTAVSVEGAQPGRPRAGVVGAEALNDVVLDQRVARPAVDGEVAVALGVELSRVVDHAVGVARVPSLATDKVAAVLPVDRVGATVAVLIVDGAAVVGPEGVVVAVVIAGGGGCPSPGLEGFKDLGGVEGDGSGAGSQGGCEEGLEGDHFEISFLT